jgi:hypothetical protein
MKRLFLLIILILIKLNVSAQPEYIDPITIKSDGTCKRFTYKDRTYHSDRMTEGLLLTFWDSSFTKIRTQVYMLKGNMNGQYKFFNEKGFLIEMCNYKNGQEDGHYYYWNDSGVLIKKEFYSNEVLIKRIKIK